MTEQSTQDRPASSTPQQLLVGVVLTMWLFAGVFAGVIACWVVAFFDFFPIVDPGLGSGTVPVGELVHAGILVGGVILGLAGYFFLRPRLHRGSDRGRSGRLPNKA